MSEPTYAATADFTPDFEIGVNAERPRAAFLVCMPRFTNPAWLSMWLTTDFTAAFCDPTLQGVPIDRLDDLRADRMTGIVDSRIGDHVEWVNEHPARKVLVRRSTQDIVEASARLWGLDPKAFYDEAFLQAELDAAAARDQINADLIVEWNTFDSHLAEIWNVCTGGLPYDGARTDFLSQYRVEKSETAGGMPPSTTPHHYSLRRH